MYLGILQFELLIRGSESLKDKRRVVNSVKDRLHREHQCSIAEIDRLDAHAVAVLGLAVVGREGSRVGEVLDAITLKLRELRDAELGDVAREVMAGRPGELGSAPDPRESHELDGEMLDYYNRSEDDQSRESR